MSQAAQTETEVRAAEMSGGLSGGGAEGAVRASEGVYASWLPHGAGEDHSKRGAGQAHSHLPLHRRPARSRVVETHVRRHRLRLLPEEVSQYNQLVDGLISKPLQAPCTHHIRNFSNADDSLFKTILRNCYHVLYPYLPENQYQHYHLRQRLHNKALIPKTTYLSDRDYIMRMLYKNCY